jgi:hypothetical protein
MRKRDRMPEEMKGKKKRDANFLFETWPMEVFWGAPSIAWNLDCRLRQLSLRAFFLYVDSV